MKKLLLLDSNALLHRAWHALPQTMSAPDGTVVNAVYGIASVVLKILKDEQPDVFIACWDTKAKTFRHEAYEGYKATRPEKEQELYDQIPLAKEVLETLGIQSLAIDGYEADDLIGTLSRMGVADGYHVRIVTGDRDSLQLIDDHVDVLTFKRGVSETKLYDANVVKEEYGITPAQVIDWKAISGDASDNIKGIKGIGDKGATDLIQKFGSMERAIQVAKEGLDDISPSLRKKLIDGEEDGLFSKKLVTIDRHVPIKRTIDSFNGTMDRDAFVEIASRFGFRSLIVRVESDGASDVEKASVKKARKSERACIHFSNQEQVVSFIDSLTREKEVAVFAEVGAQGSLFGDALQGLVIGTEERFGFISSEQLKGEGISKSLTDFLNADSPKKICHDAKALMKVLESVHLSIGRVAHDTLIAAYLLAAGERQADLELIAMQELGHALPESDVERRDVMVKTMFEIAKKQKARLAEEGLEAIMNEIELPLIPILREMERVGILLDTDYLGRLSKEVTDERNRLEKKMYELVGHEFNPASPVQLSHLLFEELGLSTKGIKKGKTAYSTAAGELEKIEDAHPIVRLIGQHREVSKLLSTYIETLPRLVDSQGRVHTTFNQAITSTGRLSSSDPNMQNIPVRTELGRKLRRAFVASKGMKLLSCDYSQIELRIAAALAKDKKMLAIFENGKDVHTATAGEIWNIPIEAVTKEQRRSAKAINFGILFGQGPQGLSRSAEISYADAKEFIDRYFETFKGIKAYLEETKEIARKNGYVETLFGRRRPIPDIASGIPAVRAGAERMAINMPIQGTEADLIKLAMIEISKGLSNISAGTRMLLQVHDELVFEVPAGDVDAVAEYAKKTMASIRKIGCPIVVDAKVGDNWEEME